MNILIIEDDVKTSSFLKKGLAENNFGVSVAHDGAEGLFLLREHHYDLIILDVMLPKIDGWEVLRQLRQSSPELRVLFLTARDTLPDRIKGFDLGADDYLAKPFSFSELLGRVKAILKRTQKVNRETIQISDLEINLLKHKVYRDKKIILLTAQEFKLLLFLAEHTGEVLSRTRIAESVWDINFNTDTNIVDVAVKRLRQKIDAPFSCSLIHTIRGIGYVLETR